MGLVCQNNFCSRIVLLVFSGWFTTFPPLFDSWTSNLGRETRAVGDGWRSIRLGIVWSLAQRIFLVRFSEAAHSTFNISLGPGTMDYSRVLETRAVGGGWRSNVLTRRYRSIRSRSQLISGQGWIYLIALLFPLYFLLWICYENKYKDQNEQNKLANLRAGLDRRAGTDTRLSQMKMQIETQLEIEMQLFRMKDSQSASKSDQGSIGMELKTQTQI